MAQHRTEQKYRDRVASVVAHIVAHPLAEHRLEDLAKLAHFSPYHFHRVYRSVTGESAMATVRRVRLALAARMLGAGEGNVTHVALEAGYESPQAFTRAFGQFVGQPPSDFQQQMLSVVLCGDNHMQSGEPARALPVEVVQRPAQRVCVIRHLGPLSTIPHTLRQLHLALHGCQVSEWLGLSFGNPHEAVTEFVYYAAAVLSEVQMPAKLETMALPGGLYARHQLVGPYTRISAAIEALYSRWLPTSGYVADSRPMIEHYPDGSRKGTGTRLRTELLIPIHSR